MDIVAKHIEPDQNEVRIAELTEISYRKLLWAHQPITDFWRVGPGYAKKLAEVGLFTMGDVARCSLGKPGEYYNEDLLYRLFGVNAELLIDHAWGWEPCTIADVKAYKPENNSMGAGQVLHCPYNFEQTKIVVKEMIDQLALDLVDKRLVTDQIVLTIGYDIKNLEQGTKKNVGEITTDWYGRKLPKHAHGTANLKKHTSSSRLMTQAGVKLYHEIVNPDLLIRRITMAANHVISEKEVQEEQQYEQMNLFTDFGIAKKEKEEKNEKLEREKKMQKAMLDIKKKYGKNAILKRMNLQEDGTAMERNRQIGGHKA
jgi:DNA polymerase V